MSLAHRLTRSARRILDLVLILLILLVLGTVAIARGVPALTGGTTFVVGGGSMEPTIPLGGVVFAMPVAADQLEVGDVVTVQVGPEKAVFTHRITRLVDRDGAVWIATRGDANDSADPSIIPATAVIGRVDTYIPYAGYAVHLLSTGQGVVFLLALGILVLAATWLLESLEIDQELARARRAIGRMQGDQPATEGTAG